MENHEKNLKLRDFFDSKRADLANFSNKFYKALPDTDWVVCQLPACSKKYLSSPKKVMIIGQENNGWGDDAFADIEKSMNGTIDFLEKNVYPFPFFNFYRELLLALNGKEFCSIDSAVWTNVFQISDDSNPKSIQSSSELVQEYAGLKLLEKEVEICQPELLVFLTGPNYDGYIQTQFAGLKFEEAFSGYTSRELARLVHPKLPKNTFRLYHPSFAQRNQGRFWQPVINLIADTAKK